MHEVALLVAGVAVFAYALLARRMSRWIVTAPMLFLALGWALSTGGIVHIGEAGEGLFILAEATLVILLFSDAAAIDARRLWHGAAEPARMLFLGLPLTIAIGTVIGMLILPGWPFWEVALLAAILAPTDAALGQPVIVNPAVPEDLRRTLSAESGLNDGLALPAVLLFASLAVGGVHEQTPDSWWVFAAQQIGLGAVIGGAVGWLGGRLTLWADARGLSNDEFEGVGVLALAGLSYLAAGAVGGNGFLAAFAGGLAFGRVMRGRGRFVFEFMDSEGQILIVAVFLLLGAALLPDALAAARPDWVLLILLALFVIRPVAIWLSLTATGLSARVKLFYGWFGPRGLATALFALLVLETFDQLERKGEILSIAILAVAISAALHGASAAPSARLWTRRSDDRH